MTFGSSEEIKGKRNGVLIKWPPGVTVGESRQLGRRWRKQEQRGGACEY